MLTATPASGYVFSGWGGACIGVTTDYCTLTMDANKSVAAVFQSQTPWVDHDQRYDGGTDGTPSGAPNAIVITHGWNADATEWVSEMANDICDKLSGANINPVNPNTIALRCSGVSSAGVRWDVWIVDWRDKASTPLPRSAWEYAPKIGDIVADTFKGYYQHIHFIAHSAGSNVIDTATVQLKNIKDPATIHETFLDAYDYAAGSHPSLPERQVSSYGKSANWADNYVDLRPIAFESQDKTQLYIPAAYNVNVTPAGNCEGADGLNDLCRHSRPYRFYGKSINPYFFDNFDKYNYNAVDLITSTAGMGYPLSVEKGKTLQELNQNYDKGKECHVIDSSCQDSPPPSPTNKVYTVVNASGVVVDQSGVAQCVVGALAIPCSQISLTAGAATSAALAKFSATQATDTPTREPAWLTLQIQTTQPTNTLQFSYQFAASGEGLLRVFVNENTVREIDQRYVPVASIQPESIYVGDLPAGTYKIAFRLDGYGTNSSGVQLTGIELGRQALVEGSGYALTVTKAGTGSGTVTGTGIDCGSDCTENYAGGTSVTLTATAATGSSFAGWSGACTGTGACTISMTTAKNVTATFTTLPKYTLIVTKSGSGTVTSNPAGINCGTDCSEPYLSGTTVALTATAATGYYFSGWSGACTGTANCTVTLTAVKSVTATFKANPVLTVSRSGSGTVVSDVAGINCGSDCSEPYPSGTMVTLTATPASGYTFAGWSGACTGTANCTVTMSVARSVIATFKAIPKYTLTIYRSGSGTVTSNPAGINCGSDCSEPYLNGTVVTLSATPASGYTFAGWSGACTGTANCTVTMSVARSVTATFKH